MLTDSLALDIARSDFDRQEVLQESLFGRFKFLLTATTLIIVASISMISAASMSWFKITLTVLTTVQFGLLIWLFLQAWKMYWGHDYLYPRSLKDYLNWKDQRQSDLDQRGIAGSDSIARTEALAYLIEAWSYSAQVNRDVNLKIQPLLSKANRIVLAMTAILVINATLFSFVWSFKSMAQDAPSSPQPRQQAPNNPAGTPQPTTAPPNAPAPPPPPVIDIVNRGLGSNRSGQTVQTPVRTKSD